MLWSIFPSISTPNKIQRLKNVFTEGVGKVFKGHSKNKFDGSAHAASVCLVCPGMPASLSWQLASIVTKLCVKSMQYGKCYKIEYFSGCNCWRKSAVQITWTVTEFWCVHQYKVQQSPDSIQTKMYQSQRLCSCIQITPHVILVICRPT